MIFQPGAFVHVPMGRREPPTATRTVKAASLRPGWHGTKMVSASVCLRCLENFDIPAALADDLGNVFDKGDHTGRASRDGAAVHDKIQGVA